MSEELKKTESKKAKQEISKDLKELVIARLEIIPSDKKISIGSSGEFTKFELIKRVEKEDEVGQKVVELELTFLRALKDGILLKEILTEE